jgi:hypothetical protein
MTSKKQPDAKKDQSTETPVWGTPEADRLITGMLGNLCAEGNRGDVVSKLISDGKLRMPGESPKKGEMKR